MIKILSILALHFAFLKAEAPHGNSTTLPSEIEGPINPKDPYCIRYGKEDHHKNACFECIEGYGPYFTDFNEATCKKCNVTIAGCTKCIWKIDFGHETNDKVQRYGCMNCTFGYFPEGAPQIFSPYHFGPKCVKCPQNCKDCTMETYCTLCYNDRALYVPADAETFNPVRSCRFYFSYKLMYFGVFCSILLAIGIWVTNLVCVRINTIETLFLVSDKAADNFVPLSKMMAPRGLRVRKRNRGAQREQGGKRQGGSRGEGQAAKVKDY